MGKDPTGKDRNTFNESEQTPSCQEYKKSIYPGWVKFFVADSINKVYKHSKL